MSLFSWWRWKKNLMAFFLCIIETQSISDNSWHILIILHNKGLPKISGYDPGLTQLKRSTDRGVNWWLFMSDVLSSISIQHFQLYAVRLLLHGPHDGCGLWGVGTSCLVKLTKQIAPGRFQTTKLTTTSVVATQWKHCVSRELDRLVVFLQYLSADLES